MKAGDKVTYIPQHLLKQPDKWQHGIIKSETTDRNGFFVVYNCAGNWHLYEDYTACNTNKRDLKPGWI